MEEIFHIMVGWLGVYLAIWIYLDKNIIGPNPFHVHLVNENSNDQIVGSSSLYSLKHISKSQKN